MGSLGFRVGSIQVGSLGFRVGSIQVGSLGFRVGSIQVGSFTIPPPTQEIEMPCALFHVHMVQFVVWNAGAGTTYMVPGTHICPYTRPVVHI